MSGHSKWATIKRKKAKIDSARAVVFQKYSRELMVSARLGGADISSNFRSRTAITEQKPQDFLLTTLNALSKKVQTVAETILKN